MSTSRCSPTCSTRSIPGPWPVGERLLVCIGNSQSLNDRVVRTGRRLAEELKAEWIAIYVETPAHNRLSRKARQEAMKGIELASSLGAETVTSFGISIADEVIRYAKKNNVTRIIIGHPIRARWREQIFGSVADQIVRTSGAIDLIIISGLKPNEEERGEKEEPRKSLLKRNPYWYSLWLILVIIHILYPHPHVHLAHERGHVLPHRGRGGGNQLGSAACHIHGGGERRGIRFLLHPANVDVPDIDSQYLITFGAFLFVGVVISLLVVRARDLALAAQRREEHTSTLYALSLDLASSRDTFNILETVAAHVSSSLHFKSAFLLPHDGELQVDYASIGLDLDEKDMTAGTWAFRTGMPAGKDTDTLSTRFIQVLSL